MLFDPSGLSLLTTNPVQSDNFRSFQNPGKERAGRMTAPKGNIETRSVTQCFALRVTGKEKPAAIVRVPVRRRVVRVHIRRAVVSAIVDVTTTTHRTNDVRVDKVRVARFNPVFYIGLSFKQCGYQALRRGCGPLALPYWAK